MSSLKAKIAVIDDDPEMRASITTLLSAYGYDAETFDSAEAFLSNALTCRAVCLLVDIQLGGISGLGLAHQLTKEGFKFAIIFMTGNGDEIMKRYAVAAGGVAFLCKPFSAVNLLAAIKKVTGSISAFEFRT